MAEDVVGKALSGHSDRVAVHAVGAYAHDSAEAAGTEFEVLVKSILKSRGIFRAEFEDLHLGGLVEVSVEPALGFQFVLFHISLQVSSLVSNTLPG